MATHGFTHTGYVTGNYYTRSRLHAIQVIWWVISIPGHCFEPTGYVAGDSIPNHSFDPIGYFAG
jgi:hypothetical protein